MKWLLDLLTPGGRRVHAAVTLGSCAALCTTLLVLALAAYRGRQVQIEIASVVTALSSLAGWAYKVGKQAGVEAPAASGGKGCANTTTTPADGGPL